MALHFIQEGQFMKILVTGANGFVGSALIPRLLESGHEVTALVRSLKQVPNPNSKVKWIEGDLSSFKSLPSLDKIDKAYFLVHGLKENSELFEYAESQVAVNFVNWIRPSGASIIYLGGLGPKDEKLSPHLRSRHLTGAILGCSGLGTIEFRASIVLGAGSLSFEMIKALAERLPIRPQLKLLNQQSQPIALKDLLKYLEQALEKSVSNHTIFEIGGPDVTTYGDLLDTYAELSGYKRKKIKLPEVDAKVLMKVLDYSIPEHANSGKKLIESLEFPTVVTNDDAIKAFPDLKAEPIRVAMDLARAASKTKYASLWEKDFLKSLLSDKILVQSGLFSPELLKNLEKVTKIKDIILKR
jgi:uncharacterized protein YbjT (DUF2867 family)